jgi:NH3-dependent NAD+ synthetase
VDSKLGCCHNYTMDEQMATDDTPQQNRSAGTNYGNYQARQRSDVQYLCAGKSGVEIFYHP